MSDFELTDYIATKTEINRICDASARLVTLTESLTLNEDTHESKILLLGEVGGNAALAVTLPPATGSGAVYEFVVSVVNTSGYTIQVTTTDIMQGSILGCTDSDGTAMAWLTGADADTITLNGTTTGGVSIGDTIKLIDVLSGTWAVSGQVRASGSEATMFSAAVS
jgi:hypothetical protein